MENHVKKGIMNSIPTIGTLSGFVTTLRKSASNKLTRKNPIMTPKRIFAALSL
jgi:hypothetical protein